MSKEKLNHSEWEKEHNRECEEMIKEYCDYKTPDLSEWFNLESYAPVEHFRSNDWLFQLEIRHKLFMMLDDVRGSIMFLNLSPQEKMEIYKEDNPKLEASPAAISKYHSEREGELTRHLESDTLLFQAALDVVRKNPLNPLSEEIPSLVQSAIYPHDIYYLQDHPNTGIRQLTYQDWHRLGDQLPARGKALLLECGGVYQMLPPDQRTEYSSLLGPDSYEKTWGYSQLRLLVDLNMPESLLIDEFKRQLKYFRTLAKTRNKFLPEYKAPGAHRTQKPPFDTWYKNQLLPCIDIYLWQLENELIDSDFKFHDRQYLDALYPNNYEKGTYVISKLKKDCVKFTTWPYLRYLTGVVTEEFYEPIDSP